MKAKLSILGSVLLMSSIGLMGCDSATATNDKQAADVEKAVVEQTAAAVKEVVEEAPQAVAEKVTEVAEVTEEVVASKVEEVAVASKETVAKVEEAVVATKEAVAPKVEEAVAATKEAIAPKVEETKEVVASAEPEKTPVQAVVNVPDFKEGKHYFEIFPTMQTDAVGGKIEVVELMWLGCPHCYDLEPTMKAYKKNLPDYVEFKQVPAMLNPTWSADGKMFYIADLLDPKGEKKLVEKIFHAIHVQKRRKMSSPDNLKNFMLQQGVSEEDYNNAADSMALTAKLNRARQISADSQAQSVPSIIINGKYRTSPYAAGGNAQLMQIVDMLTKRELNKK